MKLKELRMTNHLSQEDMGKIINTSQSNYSKYEKGILVLNQHQILALAKYFRITTDELLDNKKPFQQTYSENQQRCIDMLVTLSDKQLEKVEGIIVALYDANNEVKKEFKY